MKKTIFNIGVSLIFALIIFAGCKTDNNNKPNDIVIADEVENFVYPIPTPFEITQMIEQSGAAYIADLMNPTGKVDEYFSEKSQALNLGVYGADISYSSTYNNASHTREILACSKKLSDNLGISTMFKQKLITRVENNIENQDSLYKIVSESYYDTFNFLNQNGKGSIAVIILAGGWIEGVYLSTQAALLSENKDNIVQGIAQQKFTVNALIPLLENYKENTDVVEILTLIKEFQEIFNKVEQKDDDLYISPELFDELLKFTEKARTEIVAAS